MAKGIANGIVRPGLAIAPGTVTPVTRHEIENSLETVRKPDMDPM